MLLALVDADYKFICVYVGCNGRISVGGVFRNASLSEALEENSLNISTARSLPGGDESSYKCSDLGQLYTIPSQTKTFIPVIPIFNHLFRLKMDITGMKVLV